MSRQTRHPLLLRTKNMATAYQNLSEYDFNSVPDGSEVTVGIVVAEWNKHITEKLLEGACNTLEKHGVKAENIFVKRVPGSFELTFGAKKIAETKIKLADYKTDTDKPVNTWIWFDLTPLKDASKITLIPSSSDSGEFGMNTGKYFCIDDLTLIEK